MNRNAASELNEIEYRPLSFTAIFSSVVSLFSLAVFINIGFALISVVAIAIAGIALFSISRSDRDFVGSGFAWAAIFVSCFSIMFGISYFTLKDNHRWSAAKMHADHWLNLLQTGEYEKVHHMTLPVEDREDKETDLKVYYHPDNRGLKQKPGRQPQTGFESYFRMYVPQSLIKQDGENCKIEFVRRVKIETIPGGELYRLAYRYTPADKNLRKLEGVGRNNATIRFPLEFEVRMHRATPSNKNPDPQWHVHEVRVEGVAQTNEEQRLD